MQDRGDPHARQRALEIARRDPLLGLSGRSSGSKGRGLPRLRQKPCLSACSTRSTSFARIGIGSRPLNQGPKARYSTGGNGKRAEGADRP